MRAEMNESHPRSDGSAWVRHRREAEDILCGAGAAILHLPDFYGPQVHVSTLQNALNEAASGKTVNWLGKADVQPEWRLPLVGGRSPTLLLANHKLGINRVAKLVGLSNGTVQRIKGEMEALTATRRTSALNTNE